MGLNINYWHSQSWFILALKKSRTLVTPHWGIQPFNDDKVGLDHANIQKGIEFCGTSIRHHIARQPKGNRTLCHLHQTPYRKATFYSLAQQTHLHMIIFYHYYLPRMTTTCFYRPVFRREKSKRSNNKPTNNIIWEESYLHNILYHNCFMQFQHSRIRYDKIHPRALW